MKTNTVLGKKSEVPRAGKLRRKYILYGLGAGALLGGGYLLYSYLQDRAAISRPNVPTPILPANPQTQVIVQSNSHSFPLKKGARGEIIKVLQNALLATGGQAASHIKATSLRPDGTPDGIFGGGTEKALRAAGYPVVVSESTFSKLIASGRAKTGSNGSSIQSDRAIANELIKAANDRNAFAVLAGLQKIKDIRGYSAVSSHFKNIRILGVRVTSLVNALLSVAFKRNEPAKVKIRAEFRRIGLKQNADGVWHIPGLGELATWQEWKAYQNDRDLLSIAIVRKPTLLKTGGGNFITPPLNPDTVIGYVTGDHKGITQIITKTGETVYAPSQNLKLI